MLLVTDVGNSNITLGVFDGDKLEATFRMTTKIPRTSDEYGIVLRNLLQHSQIDVREIAAAVVSSVVPNVMHSLTSAFIKYIHVTPIIVAPGIKTGIRIATENPRQIGADRIVDAVGAYGLYGGPVIVIDYGTATTYDLVDASGAFLAGVIAPGIRTSAKALWEDMQAEKHPGAGNYYQHAGRACVWTDWPDGIYYQSYEAGICGRRNQGCGNRRAWQDNSV